MSFPGGGGWGGGGVSLHGITNTIDVTVIKRYKETKIIIKILLLWTLYVGDLILRNSANPSSYS